MPHLTVRSRRRSRGAAAVLAAVLLVTAACTTQPAYGPPQPPAPVSGPQRTVLLVGNSGAGTVSFIDAETYENLGSVDVIPDLAQRLAVINSNPVTAVGYTVTQQQQALKHFEPAGGVRYVDDMFLSPDGTTLYVSRSNLSDVVAIDLTRAGHPIQWEHVVEGFHADHATLSPDGTKVIVSATTASIAEVLDAATGVRISQFPTGSYPHQNDYSADGTHIYNASIGNVGLDYSLNSLKGDMSLRVVDATTFQVLRTYNFDRGIRPMVITPDETTAYLQLSYLNGLVKYDLVTGTTVASLDEPLSPFAAANYPTYDDYPHNSAHHGLAMSGDGSRLCDVGTIDNTVSIVSTDSMTVSSTLDVGMLPYWATTSPDGTKCFVTISGDDRVVVVDYATGQQVADVPTGFFPQRNRLADLPESELSLLSPAVG